MNLNHLEEIPLRELFDIQPIVPQPESSEEAEEWVGKDGWWFKEKGTYWAVIIRKDKLTTLFEEHSKERVREFAGRILREEGNWETVATNDTPEEAANFVRDLFVNAIEEELAKEYKNQPKTVSDDDFQKEPRKSGI